MQGDIPVLEFMGARMRLVLTAGETGGAYSLFDYWAPPHYVGPPPHWHRKTTEFFHMMSGRLEVKVDRRVLVAGADEAVHVPTGVVHTFANPHDEPAHFLVYVSPGGLENYFLALHRMVKEATEWPPKDRSAIEALMLEHDTYPPPAPED
jgi:mannose-6-phosphate isomerase-like protein (cupin superfamily)